MQSNVVSDNPVNWTPHVLDGRVKAIVQSGNTVILGGSFTEVSTASGGTTYQRANIVAVDATSGAISSSFVPKVDGEVTSLQVSADGKSVYAGGFFDTVNGVSSKSLARINLADGKLTSGFKAPAMSGRVKDLRRVGNRLWVAGTFTHIAGKNQPVLATLDATTGAFDAYQRLTFAETRRGGLQVIKLDVTPDGSKLVAIGNFFKVQGLTRPQLAVLDLTGSTAKVANWQTNFYERDCALAYDSYMRDLDISPDGKYAVVTTTGAWKGASSPCDTTARWELDTVGSSLSPSWINYSGGDTMYAVEITGPVVYIGGHFRWQNNPNTFDGDSAGPGAVGRSGIAALDPANGLPLRWNPGRTTGVGVFDILPTSQGLWVGSDTDRIGNHEYHGRIAFFPLAGGTAIPNPKVWTVPGDVYSTQTMGGGTKPIKQRWDGTKFGSASNVTAGNVDWAKVRGGFALGNSLYLGHSDGSFTNRGFNGADYGTATQINGADLLESDDDWHSEVARSTGMFLSGGRLYYTLSGQPNLYYRYFTVESGVVGATRFTASGNVSGIDFRTVNGMFVTPGKLWWGSSADGKLRRADYSSGRVVAGTTKVISSQDADGHSWRSKAIFPFTGDGTAPIDQKQAPTDDRRYQAPADAEVDENGDVFVDQGALERADDVRNEKANEDWAGKLARDLEDGWN